MRHVLFWDSVNRLLSSRPCLRFRRHECRSAHERPLPGKRPFRPPNFLRVRGRTSYVPSNFVFSYSSYLTLCVFTRVHSAVTPFILDRIVKRRISPGRHGENPYKVLNPFSVFLWRILISYDASFLTALRLIKARRIRNVEFYYGCVLFSLLSGVCNCFKSNMDNRKFAPSSRFTCL
jgi:hypothetical protein